MSFKDKVEKQVQSMIGDDGLNQMAEIIKNRALEMLILDFKKVEQKMVEAHNKELLAKLDKWEGMVKAAVQDIVNDEFKRRELEPENL